MIMSAYTCANFDHLGGGEVSLVCVSFCIFPLQFSLIRAPGVDGISTSEKYNFSNANTMYMQILCARS